jgi:predicted O-methyltransferase YrrM
MKTYGLAFLRNEMVLNKRYSIIEFGSGLSTLFMALVVKRFSLPTKIITIESETAWVDRIEKKIYEMDLSSIITVVPATIIPMPSLGKENNWYDLNHLPSSILNSSPFDMVVIDGPPAYNENISLSRFMALPFIKNLLCDKYSIFLDDADRKGEKTVMSMWKQQFGFDFKTYNNEIALFRMGSFINSHPSFLNNKLDF